MNYSPPPPFPVRRGFTSFPRLEDVQSAGPLSPTIAPVLCRVPVGHYMEWIRQSHGSRDKMHP